MSLSTPRLTVGVIALVPAIFILTLAAPDHIATWVLYAVPLLLSARLPGARAPYFMATVVTVLMFAAFPFQRRAGIPSDVLLLNRALEAGILWMAAVLIAHRRG